MEDDLHRGLPSSGGEQEDRVGGAEMEEEPLPRRRRRAAAPGEAPGRPPPRRGPPIELYQCRTAGPNPSPFRSSEVGRTSVFIPSLGRSSRERNIRPTQVYSAVERRVQEQVRVVGERLARVRVPVVARVRDVDRQVADRADRLEGLRIARERFRDGHVPGLSASLSTWRHQTTATGLAGSLERFAGAVGAAVLGPLIHLRSIGARGSARRRGRSAASC